MGSLALPVEFCGDAAPLADVIRDLLADLVGDIVVGTFMEQLGTFAVQDESPMSVLVWVPAGSSPPAEFKAGPCHRASHSQINEYRIIFE